MGRISFQKRQEEMKRQEKRQMKAEKRAQRKLEKGGQAVSPSETTREIVELVNEPAPNSDIEEPITVRSDKPRKSARPEFVGARIAELQRRLALEQNENRKTELQEEINEWQRSRPKQKTERGRW
jgi:hypothetical protein